MRRVRIVKVWPWPLLGVLAAWGGASCGGGAGGPKEGTAPVPSGAPATTVALGKPADLPPAAGSATPIAFRQFEPAGDLPARRPLVPQPTAIAPIVSKSTSKTGTVDESGDETALAEVLIGTLAPSAEKGQALEKDTLSVKDGVRLVLDTPYQIFSKVGTYVHVAAYLPSFAPAAAARVYVDGKLIGRCDGNGTFVFRDVPDATGGGNGGSHAVTVVAGTGPARVKGAANYNAFGRTQSFERANLYVYTDRGVFSPGEIIHVRAFAWRLRGDYRPFADAPVNVMLRVAAGAAQVNAGKLLSGGRVATDKMGVAWLDLPLPTTTPEGPYELAVEHLGERATARLQIKHIVAPAVKIDHTLPRFLTRDEKELGFEVKLASATGEAFKTGTVVVKSLDPKGSLVATETRAVTGNGPHKFTLGSETLKKMRDAFADDQTAAVIVDVTDASTGRHDELRRDLRISHAPYRLVVETDRNEHVPGETVKVVVHATDLEQAPMGAGNEVSIKINGESGNTLKTLTAKTDAEGLAKTTFIMPSSYADIDASLVKAPSVHGFGAVENSPPRAMFADIASPTVIERAKTPVLVKFPSQYVPSEKVVHADVVDSSGALIHSFLIPITIENGSYVAKGTFPAPSWGSMLLTFFAIGVEKSHVGNSAFVGLLTDGANLPVVASRPIVVTLKAPSSAMPGDKIEVDVSLKGPPDLADKSMRPFAIGAGISEDAFLALLDPLERTPTQIFYNPERKVMASTGSQILTWPVVQKTWGTWNYDIALPPFGFRPGGFLGPSAANPFGQADMDGSASGVGYGGGGLASGAKGATAGAPMPMATSAPKPMASPPPPPADAAMKKASKAEASTSISGDFKGREGAPSQPTAGKDVVISIRTDFAPTSLWIPEMVLEPGKDGAHTKLSAKLPDSITTQRVTVMATDDRGAIGIGTALIKVDQDVSVRSDLPATLTQGDETEVSVAVRNTRKEAVVGKISLGSTGMSIIGSSSQSITVAASSNGAAKFRVKANSAGSVPFSVTFSEERPMGSKTSGPLREDREDRRLWVTPRGIPAESRVDATLAAGKPFAFEVDRGKDDAHVEADLAIAFPSAVPMIEGLEELAEDSYLGTDADASRMLATIALEGYLIRTKAKPASIARIHQRLQLATAALLIQQQPDGGWGWRWDTWAALHGVGSGSSAYMTTHALQALAKIRDTDIPVPELAIAQGRSYLLRSLDNNSEVDVSNIAFWEGDGVAKRRAATMAAFQAIAATEKGHPVYGVEKTALDKLSAKAEAIAKGGPGSEDPLTLSSAVLGLHLHAKANGNQNGLVAGGAAQIKDSVLAGTKLLLGSYRGGYWEPSWFHAWGGRIEATRGVIELLSTVAPGTYDGDLHDAVNFILSTRPSWGAWHNSWGTAAAIEALTFLDPTAPEKPGAMVGVSVDGKLVRTVKIDPDDPFTSAAALRSVDLSSFLGIGRHEVRVAYDGALTVPASVVVRRWNAAASAQLKAEAAIQLDRTLVSASIDVGAATTAVLKVTTKSAQAELVVHMPLGGGLAVDARGMEALVRAGTIASYRADGPLVLALHALPAGTKEVRVPLVATRRGTFSLAPANAYVPRSAAEGWSGDGSVIVK